MASVLFLRNVRSKIKGFHHGATEYHGARQHLFLVYNNVRDITLHKNLYIGMRRKIMVVITRSPVIDRTTW